MQKSVLRISRIGDSAIVEEHCYKYHNVVVNDNDGSDGGDIDGVDIDGGDECGGGDGAAADYDGHLWQIQKRPLQG